MNNIMKKGMLSLITSILLIGNIFNPTFVNAEERAGGCKVTTYYYEKDWIEYENLIQKEFITTNMVTDNGISIDINMFGNIHSPEGPKSLAYLIGDSTYTKKNSATSWKPEQMFHLLIYQQVIVDKISYDISLKDLDTGRYVPVSMFINYNRDEGGEISGIYDYEVVDTHTYPGTREVEIGKWVGSLVVAPANLEWPENYEWSINGFQITNYKYFDYTGNKILEKPDYDTNSETSTICLSSGYFSVPYKNWTNESVITNYSPSISSFDYSKYQSEGSWNIIRYNWAYKVSTSAYDRTAPYRLNRSGPAGGAVAYGDYIDNPIPEDWRTSWINTDNNGNQLRYNFNPVYWDNNSSGNWSRSDDPGWCSDVTGSTRTPCYKHGGHASNPRLNSFEVNQQNRKIVPDSEKYIQKTVYVVKEVSGLGPNAGKTYTYTENGTSIGKEFVLNEEGVWEITATLYDGGGRTIEVKGGQYKIDFTKPEIGLKVVDSEGVEATPEVWSSAISDFKFYPTVTDILSGFKSGTYSFSADNGETWSNETPLASAQPELSIDVKTGIYLMRITATDNAGNSHSYISPLYYIDQTDPDFGQFDNNSGAGVTLEENGNQYNGWTSGSVDINMNSTDQIISGN